ncbi:MAG: 50S ribosome-binding GTPase [Ignavibacteria bacterium]|nr:50S ribosome-binding GTPase [Ignavibacteria bacterium]
MTNQAKSSCDTCPVHNAGNLIRLGVNMQDADFVIALAGNPNTGKSTVFNALTGLRQHTGNWPGKTVSRAEGGFRYADRRYKVVDLPGTYSLLSTSTDEEVARDFILFGQPDVTVVVVDATRVERNLNLVLQVLEITDRAVICLNLIDEARRNGVEVNDRVLAKDLGAPVVPTAARQGEGMENLLATMDEVATGRLVSKPHRIQNYSKSLERAISTLVSQIQTTFPGVSNARWVALRLLEGDQSIVEAVRTGELGSLSASVGTAVESITRQKVTG